MHRFSEEWAIVATIDPASVAVGTADSDILDMQKFDEAAFVLALGTLGTAATVDLVLQASAAADLSGPTAIRSATQLTKVGTDDNKQVILGLRNNELSSRGLRYVRARVTVAGAASQAALVVLARPFAKPASDYDLASVDEIKNTGL